MSTGNGGYDDEIADSLDLVSAVAQNKFTVELGYKLFEIFEDTDKVDQEDYEEVEDIHGTTLELVEQFSDGRKYHIEAMKQLPPEERNEVAKDLDRMTEKVLGHSRRLLRDLEPGVGEQPTEYDFDEYFERMAQVVREEISDATPEYPAPEVDMEIDYEMVARELESELDLGVELDTETIVDQLAVGIAGRLEPEVEVDMNAEDVAREVDLAEEEVARYLDVDETEIPVDESRVADGVSESRIGYELDEDEIGRAVADNIDLNLGDGDDDDDDGGDAGDGDDDFDYGIVERVGIGAIKVGKYLNFGGGDG
jgi:hypothetical protein